ncbi:MAG: ATP-binding protein [Pedobacter sp.]|nr:ATP-binding protein [Pedobacter sp.]
MVPHRRHTLRQPRPRRGLLPGRNIASALTAPLFARSPDPLFLIDAAQILRAANASACELLQLNRRALEGRSWRHAFQLERELAQGWRRNPVVQCLLSRREQKLDDDTVLVTPDGRRLPIQGRILPAEMAGNHGALLYLQVRNEGPEAHSVSRRNEHELMLQHMARLNTVSELATGIAHEMNQPLSAIMSFNQAALRLLAEETPDVDRVSEALAEAVNQTRRAAGILERLRAFVGRQGVQLRPVAVNQVVINALTLLGNKLGEAKVRVSLHTQPCPPVRADALQLEQVMVNLIRNAIEAMQETPEEKRSLHVGTHTIAGRVHVTVTDSGPGLSAQQNPPLFTRFFTTKPDGMGLGLSISRTILEAAGGELDGSNTPEGGACFRFSLPAFITEEMRHGHSLV